MVKGVMRRQALPCETACEKAKRRRRHAGEQKKKAG
jgi:hypothetical protein